MTPLAKTILGIIVIIILALLAWAYFAGNRSPVGTGNKSVMCTMEAKLCPDGSYVGRSGPKCEFAACPGSVSTSTSNVGNQGIAPYNSGVKGVVMLGPTCPVERNPPDPNCSDKPYSTLVTVFRTSDPVHAYAISKSDASGMFSFSMPPGDYTLGAGESNLPRCDHPAVTVKPNVYTLTTIACDTGIR